jgi:hypothetical protein
MLLTSMLAIVPGAAMQLSENEFDDDTVERSTMARAR